MKILILLVFLCFQLTFTYSQSIQRLVDSSNLIIEGKIVSLANQIAKVSVVKVFAGKYDKDTISIWFPPIGICIIKPYDGSDHFIAFLNYNDTIAKITNRYQGLFDFENEITEDFPQFLTAYLSSQSDNERKGLLLKYYKKGFEFSILIQDLANYHKQFTVAEEQDLYTISREKTLEVIQNQHSNQNQSSRLFFDTIEEYDFPLWLLTSKKIKRKAVNFLRWRLSLTENKEVAFKTLYSIARIKPSKSLMQFINQYNKKGFLSDAIKNDWNGDLQKKINEYKLTAEKR